LKGGAGARPP